MKVITVLSVAPLLLQCTPDSALVLRDNPWFVPDDGAPGQWAARLFAGAVIHRLGRSIAPRFASRYYDRLVLCAHTDNPDAPKPLAWCRDGAIIVGDTQIDVSDQSWCPMVLIDGGAAIDMPDRQAFDTAVSAVSKYMTLRTGDIVLLPLAWPRMPLSVHVDTRFTDTDGRTLLEVRPR